MSRLFRRKTNGIVNVKMVITEEKILSNIDKIQKLINPKSKKQIVKLDEDAYFKDLVESVKSYLLEYPKKNNFPSNVYNAAYGLVEFATNQFEENTKSVEELIRKREKNIKLASVLRDATKVVKANAKNWKAIVKKLEPKYSPDVAENLNIIGNAEDKESAEYKKACKAIDVKVGNLEANLHIEIDMERIEDASKALSYIGLEIAEALKYIPAPVTNEVEETVKPKATKVTKAKAVQPVQVAEEQEDEQQEEQEQAKATKTTKTAKGVKASKVAGKKAKAEQEEQDNDDDNQNNKPKFGGISKKNKIKDIEEELDEETEEVEDYETEEDYEEEADIDVEAETNENVSNAEIESGFEEDEYLEETRFEKKPSLWQRIKNSKLVRTINYILKIRVVLDYPALPDVDGNK